MFLKTLNVGVEVRERGEDDSRVSGLCSWVDSCAFNGDIPHLVTLCTPCPRHADQHIPASGSLKQGNTVLLDTHSDSAHLSHHNSREAFLDHVL